MFYIKSNAELLEIVLLEQVFDQEMPYFAELEMTPATVLQLPQATIQRKGDACYLVWNPETATWCFINEMEYQLCRLMSEPIQYTELRQKHWPGPEIPEDRLIGFLTHLYRRGLLAVDGKTGIDQKIYARGPLFVEMFKLELMLTEKCNLGCTYCFAEADNSKADMTFAVGKQAIDKMLALPHKRFQIKFSGGEPLSKFDLLMQLLEYAWEANKTRKEEAMLLFDITTNGTLITDRVIEALQRYPIRLCISFDGLPEIHDGMRFYLNSRGSHRDVVAAIRRLQEHEIPFRVITVIRRPHVQQAKELFRYYDDLGIKFVRFNPMTDAGRGGLVEQRDGITPDEYFIFMKQVVEHMGEHFSFNEDNIQFMVRNLIYRTRDFTCMRSPCGAGSTFMNVDPQGNIHPCAYYRSSTRHIDLGNVHSQHLSLDTCGSNHPIVLKMAQRTAHTIPQCSTCTWRHVCTGGCALSAYTKYGDLSNPTDLCHYYMQMYPFLLEYLYRRPELAPFLLEDGEPVVLS